MRTLSLLAIALVASTQAAEPLYPGLGGSITQTGVNNLKNIVSPYIFNQLKNLTIPEIDISGGSFTNLVIDLPMPALSNIKTSLDGANNGLELNV